jgi:hypothetical protein
VLAFTNLKEIMDLTIKWEKKLKDFYDVAEFALRNDESKRVVVILRKNLVDRLEITKNINLNDYGKTQWIQYAPDYKDDELIPIKTISRDADPKDIFNQILDYEKKLKSFYETIANKLVVAKQKDLFESLSLFKDEQIFEINKFIDSFYKNN